MPKKATIAAATQRIAMSARRAGFDGRFPTTGGPEGGRGPAWAAGFLAAGRAGCRPPLAPPLPPPFLEPLMGAILQGDLGAGPRGPSRSRAGFPNGRWPGVEEPGGH